MTRASLSYAFGFIILSIAIGCDSGQTGYGSKQSGKATDAPLVALPSSAARIENEEGVGHFQQGHWDVAMEHYQKAVKADPNSAVVHYNVALTLDKMGKHAVFLAGLVTPVGGTVTKARIPSKVFFPMPFTRRSCSMS